MRSSILGDPLAQQQGSKLGKNSVAFPIWLSTSSHNFATAREVLVLQIRAIILVAFAIILANLSKLTSFSEYPTRCTFDMQDFTSCLLLNRKKNRYEFWMNIPLSLLQDNWNYVYLYNTLQDFAPVKLQNGTGKCLRKNKPWPHWVLHKQTDEPKFYIGCHSHIKETTIC